MLTVVRSQIPYDIKVNGKIGDTMNTDPLMTMQ